MNILVTGGAGYLGSILVPDLLRDGHAVTVVDNFLYRQNSLAHVCADPAFRVIAGDARDASVVRKALAGADVVIPLAALVGAPACDRDPVAATTVNHDAVLMLFGMIGSGQAVIMPTTNSAYGSGDADHFCDETSPLRPVSRYAVEKVRVEEALLGLPNAVSLRLATVFGMSPRMRIDLLVNDFTHRAVRDGALVLFEAGFRRNFIHVRDVSRAFRHVLAHFDAMRGGIYNVGLSDANLSKRQLCERIRRQVPGFVFFEAATGSDPDRRDYIVSNAKIEAAGFRPEHSLDAGIAELIKGYAMLRTSVYGNV